MAQLPHVTWLRAFEAAARSSSFSAAAEELHLTPAAISQQIKLLEQHLGVQLFIRLPRGVALTDMGHAYAQPIARAFAEMQQATGSLFAKGARRRLRVHASISFAALVLAPALPAFRQQHPDIDLEVTTAVWTDPTEGEDVDVEIRFGHGDWPDADIRHLGHRQAELVCHPSLVTQAAPDFERLAEQAVQIIGSESDWPQMAALLGAPGDLPACLAKVDSSLIALQWVTGGAGAAIISQEFLQRYRGTSAPASPYAARLPLARSFFIVLREPVRQNEAAELFAAWLMTQV